MSSWLATTIAVLRFADVVMAVTGILLSLAWLRRWQWRGQMARDRFIWMGLIGLLIGGAYGQLEQILENTEPGVRTIVVAVALVYINVGLIGRLRCGAVNGG